MNHHDPILLTIPAFNQIQDIPSLKPIDHDFFNIKQLCSIDEQPQQLLLPHHHHHEPHEEDEEEYWNLSSEPPDIPHSNRVFSWDSFDRPLGFQSSLIYQTPYPTEQSVQVWEAILSRTGLKLSSPISRKPFILDFFRRSIGLKTIHSHVLPKTPITLYPRVLGQTDDSTRSIRSISDTAYKNLSTIETFIRLNHHPCHPFQCLSSNLIILIHWIRTEIMHCFQNESVLNSGLLSSSLILEPILQLLVALANLVETCESEKHLKQEDVVYQNLNYHIRKRSSNLIQAVLSWLLDRVCVALLLSWQTWIGIDLGVQPTIWGDEKDQLHHSLWNYFGIQSNSHIQNQNHTISLDHLDQLGSTPSTYSV